MYPAGQLVVHRFRGQVSVGCVAIQQHQHFLCMDPAAVQNFSAARTDTYEHKQRLIIAWYPLKVIFDELATRPTHEIEEMSSDKALKFTVKLQAVLDDWISRKRGLANMVSADQEAPSEVNIVIDLHGKSHEFSSLQAVPPDIMNQWIAHLSKQGLAKVSVKDQRGNGDRKRANSVETGTCARGDNCPWLQSHDSSHSGSSSKTPQSKPGSRDGGKKDF